jgi:hypothetical protein
MNAASVTHMPNPKIRVLNSGVIRIQIDDLVGFVDSQHLVDPKILQLQVAWRQRNNPRGVNQQPEV